MISDYLFQLHISFTISLQSENLLILDNDCNLMLIIIEIKYRALEHRPIVNFQSQLPVVAENGDD